MKNEKEILYLFGIILFCIVGGFCLGYAINQGNVKRGLAEIERTKLLYTSIESRLIESERIAGELRSELARSREENKIARDAIDRSASGSAEIERLNLEAREFIETAIKQLDFTVGHKFRRGHRHRNID